MSKLDDLRLLIDEIDHEILSSLLKRRSLCLKVAKYKQEHQIQIHNKLVEKDKLDLFKSKYKDLDEEFISNLYKLIFDDSKKLQSKHLKTQ